MDMPTLLLPEGASRIAVDPVKCDFSLHIPRREGGLFAPVQAPKSFLLQEALPSDQGPMVPGAELRLQNPL